MTRDEAEVAAIRLDEGDNVAVLLAATNEGQTVRAVGLGAPAAVTASAPIPQFHKIALAPIAKGDVVWRRKTPIGTAVEDIACGDWVHVHNLKSLRAKRSE